MGEHCTCGFEDSGEVARPYCEVKSEHPYSEDEPWYEDPWYEGPPVELMWPPYGEESKPDG